MHISIGNISRRTRQLYAVHRHHEQRLVLVVTHIENRPGGLDSYADHATFLVLYYNSKA